MYDEKAATQRFQNKSAPWAGFGTVIPPDMPRAEWAKASGLDWELKRNHKFWSENQDKGPYTRIPNKFAWTRGDEVYAETGFAWQPLQNVDALNFMAEYAEAGGVTVEVAGAMAGGKVPFCLARINREFEIGKGDRVKSYLVITSPHIVGQSIKVKTLTMRLICLNGMTSTNESSEYSQSHIHAFNFDMAKERVAFAHEELGKMEKRFKTISKLKLNIDDAMRKVIIPVFEPELTKVEDVTETGSRKLNEILTSILHSPGAQPETGWGVLNGVTHWADHVAGRSSSARLMSGWLGKNNKAKHKVENLLFEMAQ